MIHSYAPTDLIDVSSLAICVYGPPGVGKTTLAQTASAPLTLDLDCGAHRAFNRALVMRFDEWKDLEHANISAAGSTVIIDTVGRALDLLAADIIAGSAKCGSRTGGLTLQGYGSLKSRFASWNAGLVVAKTNRVYLAHEREERDGDDRIMRPEAQGASYGEVMKSCDLVGYLYRDRAGKRWLDFNPSDRHLGKNAAAWPVLEVPDLAGQPTFLADLIADAQIKIGRTSEAATLAAQVLGEWQARFDADPTTAQFNGLLEGLKELKTANKPLAGQVWQLFLRHARKAELLFDQTALQFVPGKECVSSLPT